MWVNYLIIMSSLLATIVCMFLLDANNALCGLFIAAFAFGCAAPLVMVFF